MKLCSSSLVTANNLINNILGKEADNINLLTQEIEKFSVSATSEFVGEVWDTHRATLSHYITILKSKTTFATSLSEAANGANAIMSGFLEKCGKTEYSDDKYDELVAARDNAYSSRDEVSDNDDGQISAVSAYVTGTGMTLAEIENEITRMNDFRAADIAAHGKLSSIDSLITAAGEESYDV